jgi:hypothetical protein
MCHDTQMARLPVGRRMPREKRRGKSAKNWVEKAVHLSGGTVTLFEGPGDDWLLVLHGRRKGSGLLSRLKRRTRPS